MIEKKHFSTFFLIYKYKKSKINQSINENVEKIVNNVKKIEQNSLQMP
jgi:hypothetical protein